MLNDSLFVLVDCLNLMYTYKNNQQILGVFLHNEQLKYEISNVKTDKSSFTDCVLVTFADFLGSDYRFKQLIEFFQLFLLVSLLTTLISIGQLHKHGW